MVNQHRIRAKRRQDRIGIGQAGALDQQPVEGRDFAAAAPGMQRAYRGGQIAADHAAQATRSEEHTSELQSLMRISYAVFCLKKKTKHTRYTTTLQQHTHDS